MHVTADTTRPEPPPGAGLSQGPSSDQHCISPFKITCRDGALQDAAPSETSLALPMARSSGNGSPSESTDPDKKFSFLGARVIEHQTGGALSCD